MKILIIGQLPPPYGGQSINIEKMVQILDKHGFNYRFIRMDFSTTMNDMGSFSLKKLLKLAKVSFRILTSLLLFRPGLVYYPPAGPVKAAILRDFALLFPIRLFRFTTVYHYHAGGLSEAYTGLSPFFKWFYRFVYFNNEYAVCLSRYGHRDPLFLQTRTIVTIPSGVTNKHAFHEKTVTGACTVLFAGVCRESKGVLDFIEVIRQCRLANGQVTGRIIGEIFDEKERLAITRAQEAGIIRYEGVKTGAEKDACFATAHILLFPTFFEAENFPTVHLEAFSYGIPVVSTSWRGIPDQVTDGYNGFLHNLHDIQGMTKSVLLLASDTTLYRRLSSNARKDYETRYTDNLFEEAIVKNFKQFK